MRGGADRPRLDVGLVVGDLVVAEGDVHQHLVGGVSGQRVRGHPVRVAVRLAAVPEHLHQDEDQRPRELRPGRRGRGQRRTRRSRPSAGAAPSSSSPARPSDARVKSGDDRGEGAAHDPALAVAVVVEVAGVDHRGAARVPSWWKAASVAKPLGLIITRPRKSSSSRPCCSRSGSCRELGEVLQGRRSRSGTSPIRHADLIGRAEDDVVRAGECSAGARGDLDGAAEQAVPVERRARRTRRGPVIAERGDDAVEVGGPGCRSGSAARWRRAGSVPPGPQFGSQVAGHREACL